MQIVEKIKAHPKLAIAALVGILVLVYILNHAKSGTTATAAVGGDGTDVGSAQSILAAQQQAASQAAQINGAVAANASNNDAAVQVATIQAQTSAAHDALAAQVATSNINASQQVQSLLASLSADVAKGSQGVQVSAINADVSKVQIQATSQTEQQRILANALVAQSANQAQVAQASINASKDIATQSWFDKIF